MPLMNGWEFRERQREDPALVSIPVIVMSGWAPSAHRTDTLGAVASSIKPVEVPVLESVSHCFA